MTSRRSDKSPYTHGSRRAAEGKIEEKAYHDVRVDVLDDKVAYVIDRRRPIELESLAGVEVKRLLLLRVQQVLAHDDVVQIAAAGFSMVLRVCEAYPHPSRSPPLSMEHNERSPSRSVSATSCGMQESLTYGRKHHQVFQLSEG